MKSKTGISFTKTDKDRKLQSAATLRICFVSKYVSAVSAWQKSKRYPGCSDAELKARLISIHYRLSAQLSESLKWNIIVNHKLRQKEKLK